MFIQKRKVKRKTRMRDKVRGVPQRPRLAVFRSNAAVYVQLIDDTLGATLIGMSEQHLEDADKKGTKLARARALGLLLAKKAKAKKITTIVFDRGGYIYTGRIQAVAEGARAGGLVF